MSSQKPVYEQLGLSLPPLEYLAWLEQEERQKKAKKETKSTVIEVEL
jgi:hypothetical protein